MDKTETLNIFDNILHEAGIAGMLSNEIGERYTKKEYMEKFLYPKQGKRKSKVTRTKVDLSEEEIINQLIAKWNDYTDKWNTNEKQMIEQWKRKEPVTDHDEMKYEIIKNNFGGPRSLCFRLTDKGSNSFFQFILKQYDFESIMKQKIHKEQISSLWFVEYPHHDGVGD